MTDFVSRADGPIDILTNQPMACVFLSNFLKVILENINVSLSQAQLKLNSRGRVMATWHLACLLYRIILDIPSFWHANIESIYTPTTACVITMSFLTEGYLHLNIDGSSPTVRYISISIQSTAFLIQFVICMVAIVAIRRNPQTNWVLKIFFLASAFAALLTSITSPLMDVFRGENDFVEAVQDHNMNIGFKITSFIWNISGTCFLVSILCTVIVKLYLTFKQTAFKMSMIRLNMVIPIFCMFMLTYSVLHFIFGVYGLGWVLLLSSFLLYIAGCFFAVYCFVTRLLALAMFQATTPRNMDVAPGDRSLNLNQQQLADLATKTMMLFGFQITSTILIICALALALPWVMRRNVYCIDITINLFCSYLQFAWAEKHYRKCCGCCDDIFRSVTSKWIRRKIFAHSTSMCHIPSISMGFRTSSIDSGIGTTTPDSVDTPGSIWSCKCR